MELNNFDRFGSILKAARKAKGLTREQLAEIINITPRYLMSIENENKKWYYVKKKYKLNWDLFYNLAATPHYVN